jgi:PAS domain S-box-containing protein
MACHTAQGASALVPDIHCAALDALHEGVLILDARKTILFANRVLRRCFGFRGPLNGRVCHEALYGLEQPCDGCDPLQALDQEHPVRQTLRQHKRDGSLGTFVVRSTPLVDATGRPVGVIRHSREVRAHSGRDETVQEVREQYRALFENALTGMFLLTPRGRPLRINAAGALILGFESPVQFLSEVEQIQDLALSGRSLSDFLHRLHNSGTVHQAELPMRRRDGREVWVSVNAAVVQGGGDTAACIQGCLLDVTHRHHAAEALRRSQQTLRALLDSAFDALLLLSPDGQVLESNHNAQTLFGLSEEWLNGRHLARDLSAVERTDADMYGLLRKALRSGKAFFHWSLRSRRRGSVEAEIALRRIAMEGRVLLLANIRDLTIRRWNESEHLRLNTAVNQAGDGILVTDRNGRIIYANPAFHAMTGYTPGQTTGRHISFFHGRDQESSLWHRSPDGRTWQGSMTMDSPRGTTLEIQATLAPVEDSTGRVINYVAVLRDVTQERALERKLRQSQKMEAIGRLAGGIAHDLNNCLLPIMLNLEMALEGTGDTGHQEACLQDALTAAGQARDLVHQVLEFHRNKDAERVHMPLVPLVKEVVKLWRPSLGPTIEVRQEYSALRDVVHANPSQMQQVVMNLVTNAAQAMAEQGGTLSVEVADLEPGDTEAPAQLAGSPLLMLRVSDTGPGIRPDQQMAIFEPFFTTKEHLGTGLGLTIVQQVVQSMGGLLRLHSSVNQGSCFEVWLPLARQPSEPARAALPAALDTDCPPCRIMLVDDDPLALRSLCDLLKNRGHAVSPYGDPNRALARLAASPREHDILVTDQAMPALTGLDLARLARDLNQDMGIMLITGYGHGLTAQEARAAGVDLLLHKPCSVAEVVAALAALHPAQERSEHHG